MISLLADENIEGTILNALNSLEPALDLVRVQDVGLMATPDPVILKWAAERDRVLLSHDVQTIPKHAYDRVRDEEYMPGVVMLSRDEPPGIIAEAVVKLAVSKPATYFENRVVFVPDETQDG